MKCESCYENAATVHVTEIKGDQRRTQHLCEECWRSRSGRGPVLQTVKCESCAEKAATISLIGFRDDREEKHVLCAECAQRLAERRRTARDVLKGVLKWITRKRRGHDEM